MGREIVNVKIVDEGRDYGKVFVMEEWPSGKTENWAMRVLLALMAGNVNLPNISPEMGAAGMAEVGLQALARLHPDTVEPLMAEMLSCVQIMPDPSKPHVIRALQKDDYDIEEVSTRLRLRVEFWKLHMGFLLTVARLFSTDSRQEQAAVMEKPQRTPISRRR